MNRRVLLVGATGVFGSRLAAMLAKMPGVELVLAARGVDGLERLRAALARDAKAALSIHRFDRDQPHSLRAIAPWLVIDAAGPFQDSGYRLPLAAVRAGAHYLDLADGRSFVARFAAAVHPEAVQAGVLAVAGASSSPALSNAALEALVRDWRGIDRVSVAISPGARAPRGMAVVQAILSYAGRPVRLFRGGRWTEAPGWSGLRRIRMPGLGHRLVSVCETPDLDLLPARFQVRGDALFLAGLELAPLHLGLALLSLPVRWRLLPSLRPLARPLRALAGFAAPLGSDRGGMVVEASGEDETGSPIRARWALWAEANAGPSTPAAPAAALVRGMVEGWAPPVGAYACAGLLTLGQIERELAGLPIRTRIDQSHPEQPALFRRLLGRRFDALPPAVRRVHAGAAPAVFHGHAVARAGHSVGARLAGRVLGLPPSGRSEVEVQITPDGSGETWRRRFGAARFASRLVSRSEPGVFEERFGPLRFAFELNATSRGVRWTPIGWSFAGLPLPRALAPRLHARAEEADGAYRFSVAAGHPWFGLLFAYRGRLA